MNSEDKDKSSQHVDRPSEPKPGDKQQEAKIEFSNDPNDWTPSQGPFPTD